MQIYAVIDTNVIVSALISRSNDAPTVRVLKEVLNGRLIPLYHAEILHEYNEVLSRDKFHLDKELIKTVIDSIITNGKEVFPKPTGEILVDMDDLIFYEVAMEKQDDNSYLVTGNMKHYPIRDFIVTPYEMMCILDETENNTNNAL